MQDSGHFFIGDTYIPFFRKPLLNLGYSVSGIPENPCVASAVSSHADLSILAIDNTVFAARYLKNTELPDRLTGYNIRFISEEQSPMYPNDVQLNVCIIGKKVILNRNTVAAEVLEYLQLRDYQVIHVNQGYAGCSSCVIDENSLISSDPGICKVASRNGLHVLQISPGFIDLPGYDYGFIGGSTIRLSKQLLAFSGTLDHMPEKAAIFSFLEARNVHPVFLTKERIFDFGGSVRLPKQTNV